LRNRAEGAARFLKFAGGGGVGFLVDAVLLELLRPSLGPYGARAVSATSALVVAYIINRRFVFPEAAAALPWFSGWLRFAAANAAGFSLNVSIYWLVVRFAPPPLSLPLGALCCGAGAGLVCNYLLASRLVFVRPAPKDPKT
jgi:putative flippase GtrA